MNERSIDPLTPSDPASPEFSTLPPDDDEGAIAAFVHSLLDGLYGGFMDADSKIGDLLEKASPGLSLVQVLTIEVANVNANLGELESYLLEEVQGRANGAPPTRIRPRRPCS